MRNQAKRENCIFKMSLLIMTVCALLFMFGINVHAATTVNTITENKDVTGTLTGSSFNDKIYYSFTAPGNGYFTVTVKHADTGQTGDYSLEIRNDKSESLYSTYGSYCKSPIWPCKRGTTYILVVGYSFDVVGKPYTVRVDFTETAGWELEPNENQSTATALSWNTPVKGNILGSNDKDWYKLTVTKPGYFYVSIEHQDIAHTGEYRMEMYTRDGTKIYGPNYGKAFSSRINAFNVGNEIYVVISNSYSSTWQPYTLKASFVASTVYESEGNNTAATADSVVFNTTYKGMLDSCNDSADWFTFTNPTLAKVTLNFGPVDIANKGERNVYIVDAKGNEERIYRADVEKNCTMTLNPRRYYIKITNSWNGNDKQYRFKLSRTAFKLTGKNTIKTVKAKTTKGWWITRQIQKVTMKSIDKNAEGCEVKIAKNRKMRNPLYDNNFDKAKKFIVNYSVSAKGTYYVQVTPFVKDAFGNKIYGKKSNVAKVKVK